MSLLAVLALSISITSQAESYQITPTHCFRSLSEIVFNLNRWRDHRNISAPIAATFRERNKSPQDVYQKVSELEIELKRFAVATGAELPALATTSNSANRRVIPADVFSRLESIRQAMRDISSRAGMQWQPLVEPVIPGKTPPDVYRQLTKAIYLLETLR